MKEVLSFFSLRGCLGCGAFWWRQLAVSLLLFVGSLLFNTGDMLLAGRPLLNVQPAWLEAPLLVNVSCFPNMVAMGWGGVVAEDLTALLLYEPVPSAFCAWALVLLGLVLSLLASWCCVALILKRLRDTRGGLWLLPLCATALWLSCLEYLPLDEDVRVPLMIFLVLLPQLLYCRQRACPAPQAR